MRSSLKIQFIAVFSSFILFSCVVISVMAGKNIFQTGSYLARQQGEPVVEKAVSLINGDEFQKIAQSMDPSDPDAEAIRLRLLDLKQSVGCQYLFTMTQKSGNDFLYVIDGSCDPSDTENYSPMGTVEDIEGWGNAPFETMKTGEITCSGLVNQDGWGWKISTFKAIKNSSGKIVGFVGCDFDVGPLIETMKGEIIKIGLIGLTFVILGGFIVFLFSNSIFGTMQEISSSMEKISQGTADLTQRIPVKKQNELGSLAANCNKVIESLAVLVGKLQQQSEILDETGNRLSERMGGHVVMINSTATSVHEINARVSTQSEKIIIVSDEVQNVNREISNLNARMEDQSSAIGQSSSAIEEISSNIQSVNKTVEMITGQFEELVQKAKEGTSIQNEVSSQIEEIALQSENLTEANAAIAAIAEQTNLLAMNAAIEAAHAGDLGKGFGVVADEIRRLAETSATQSGQIRTLLEGISGAIQEIVNSSKNSSLAFENVGSKISGMDGLMREIKTGMAEEMIGVDNILQTMNTLNNTTSAITSASKTMKSSSENVLNEISELKAIANETYTHSEEVSNSMEEMRETAEEAAKASQTSCQAVGSVVNMITGFKVK